MSKPFAPERGEVLGELELTFPKLVSVKLDGVRAVTPDGKAYSKSMKPIPNKHMSKMLEAVPGLDGEIIVGPPNAPDVYRKTFSLWNTINRPEDFTFYVFDDLSNLLLPYEDRIARLMDRTLPGWVRVLPQKFVTNLIELEDLYEKTLAMGFEGLICRDPAGIYKFGKCSAKSQQLIKMKPFDDKEARIVSAYEGMTNNNEATINELGHTERSTHQENKVPNGRVGGFNCIDIETNQPFKVAPGLLTHDELRALWLVKETLPGKLIKYRSLPVGVKDKPRHGRFYGWKSELDM